MTSYAKRRIINQLRFTDSQLRTTIKMLKLGAESENEAMLFGLLESGLRNLSKALKTAIKTVETMRTSDRG